MSAEGHSIFDGELRRLVLAASVSKAGETSNDTTAGEMLPESPPRVGHKEVIRMLEADLIDEVKSVAAYTVQIERTKDARVKMVLLHIRDEEDAHIKELENLIAFLQRVIGR